MIGQPVEGASGIPTGPFDLYDFGNVENTTGATLDSQSNANLVTKLNRPEDGAWDPNNPNDFYFVTHERLRLAEPPLARELQGRHQARARRHLRDAASTAPKASACSTT